MASPAAARALGCQHTHMRLPLTPLRQLVLALGSPCVDMTSRVNCCRRRILLAERDTAHDFSIWAEEGHDKGTAPPKQPGLQAPHSTMLRYAPVEGITQGTGQLSRTELTGIVIATALSGFE